MLRPTGRLLLEVIGILVAGLAVAVAFGLWRLSAGPVRIDALTPYVEQALSDAGINVRIEGTEIRWDGFGAPLGLAVRGVSIDGPAGNTVARLPELSFTLRAPDLVRGSLSPEAFEVVGAQIYAERTEDGRFEVDLGALGGAGDSEVLIDRLLQALSGPRGIIATGPLGALESVTVRDASILVADRRMDRTWSIPRASFSLQRSDVGLSGDAMASVELEERVANLRGRFSYRMDDRTTRASFRFDNVVPESLRDIADVLIPLEAITTPVRGDVAAVFDRRLEPLEADFRLFADAPVIAETALYSRPITAAAVEVFGHVDLVGERLDLTRFHIDLGGPQIDVTGQVSVEAGVIKVDGRLAVAGMPTDLIPTYWPDVVRRGGRGWITQNLSGGMVDGVDARIRISAPVDRRQAMSVEMLQGGLSVSGLTVRYLPGLPTVTGVSGTATFDLDGMVIVAEGGDLGDVRVEDGRIVLGGFNEPDQWIDIDLGLTGPARTVMDVLDRPRLGYPSRLGLDTSEVTGTVAARVRFAFPLIRELQMERVAFAVAANARDVGLGPVAGGRTVQELDAEVLVDGQGITVAGTTLIEGVPATVEWRQPFDMAQEPMRLVARATLDDADRRALRLPEIEGLRGPVDAVMTLTQPRGEAIAIQTAVDLRAAALSLSFLDWTKPAGEAGRASVSFRIIDDRVPAIDRLDLEGAGLAASARLSLDGAGRVRGAEVRSLRLGRTDVAGSVELGDGAIIVDLEGPALDVSGFFGDDEEAASSAAEGQEEPAGPDLDLSIEVTELVLGPDRSLSNVAGRMIRRAGEWRDVDVSGLLFGGGTFAVSIRPDPDGGESLQVTSTNAGSFLRALDITQSIWQGTATIQGRRPPGERAISGLATMTDFRFLDSVGAQRLIEATSPEELRRILAEEGIAFDRFESRFGWRRTPGFLTLEDGRASGSSLGITFGGRVDLASEQVDMTGTIVPVYGLNAALGAIPILGQILTGGQGGGLFAFTYSVIGPLDDPAVSVNPLSVLTPGFLRTLFFQPGGATGAVEAPEDGPPTD